MLDEGAVVLDYFYGEVFEVMGYFFCFKQKQRDLVDDCEDVGRKVERDDEGFGCFFDYSDDEMYKFIDEVDLVIGGDCFCEGVEDATEGGRGGECTDLLLFLEHASKYFDFE